MMTLQELKGLLATYGVNDEERNAPVVLDLGSDPVPVTGAEVDWMPGRGHVVILTAQPTRFGE